MSDASGTLETVAIELSKLLRPLATDLSTPGRTRAFFAQMGFTLTDAQVAGIAAPLSGVATRTTELVSIVTDLVRAIEDENYATLTTKSVEAIQKIALVISDLSTLGNNLGGLVGVPADQVARRIFDYLLFNYLDDAKGLNEALELFGLLEREEHNEDSTDPNNPPFTVVTYHFDEIGGWFTDPAAQVRRLYDWGEAGFNGRKLFSKLEGIAARAGLPVIYDPGAGSSPARLDLVLLELVPKTDVTPHGLLLRLKSQISSGEQTIPLGAAAHLDFKVDFQLPPDMGVFALPDGTVGVTPPSSGASFGGGLLLKVVAQQTSPPEPFILFGQAGGSRLELGRFTLTTGTTVTWAGDHAAGTFLIQGEAVALKVIVDTTNADGFLGKILPGTRVEADFNILVGVSTERGFYFSGSSALEVRLPAHIELGPVALEALTITAALEGGEIPVSVGADIRAALGPLVAVVQNMGVTATFSFAEGNTGNLGPLEFGLGFKPPDGVGLSIDTGVVKGGGFLHLDFRKGEYYGALELSFKNVITLKAVGIINTKMEDGSRGFALLILVTAEFTPIQLGFGFTLNGVGGLLALNRTLDTDALRAGVRTGAVSSILFPHDVVANINRIISDLKTIFPIAEGHFVIGPMGKFGWGSPTLISLEVGFILDIPRPAFVIIGVLRCILPSEEAAVLRLQVNFAGGVDFDRELIWFDASLFDSRLLVFTLTGDMALRIGWGDHAIFVISVGGFHPAFRDTPPDLRDMRRLSISLLSGENPRLSVQTYFAITSNSVQSGARAELYAEACGFNLYGFLGYDLLVQFKPFHFVADIYAGLALRAGTDVLFGIDVHCQLSGPTPWNARGEASFQILFFRVSVGFDVTWGEEAPAQIEQTVEVLPLVRAALSDDRNWTAALPANAHHIVTLRKAEPPPGGVLLHPFGVLSVSQKVAPLGIEISKFGELRPTGDTRFELTYGGGGTEEVREEFAAANFTRLSDSEKLSRNSFERMRSGLRFATGDSSRHGANVQKDVSYELSYVHRRRGVTIKAGVVNLLGSVFSMLTRGGAVSKNTYAVGARAWGAPTARVETSEPEYVVVNASDLTPHAPGLSAKTMAEAYHLHDRLVAADPSLRGRVLVVSSHELD